MRSPTSRALFKYEVKGKGAARLLSRMTVRGFEKMQVGRVAYTCWCDANGKVIDDGTVSRLGEDHFFITAAEPTAVLDEPPESRLRGRTAGCERADGRALAAGADFARYP